MEIHVFRETTNVINHGAVPVTDRNLETLLIIKYSLLASIYITGTSVKS